MAASSSPYRISGDSRKSPVSKSGVLTISGYSVRVRMQSGHLEIEDGAGEDRRTIRLARVGHGLKRLVCISEDGVVSLAALKWLSDIGASFTMLDRLGKVRFVTGPSASTDSKIRRAQALAAGTRLGVEISRTLIDAKLEGQERLVRELNDAATADVIANFRDRLLKAETVDAIRLLEAHSAVAYFGALRDVPVLWSRADRRKVPQRWLTVGSRHSPLSGGPRSAVTPVMAILNYCAALLESATRISVVSLGLLPDLGLGLHTDTPNRDSLVFDVLEPVRPDLESWLVRWVTNEPLRRADFFEMGTGCVRLKSDLCARLSEIAPTLGKLVSPWAEYVQSALWQSTSQSKSACQRVPATRLTQRHRRRVKGSNIPAVALPRPDHLCSCGKKIPSGETHCLECSAPVTRKNFAIGRKVAQRTESLAKRSTTMTAHRAAIANWKPSDLPAFFTREFYIDRIMPALAKVPKVRIRSTLNVSEPYTSFIQSGKRIPHARFWLILARLAGIVPPM